MNISPGRGAVAPAGRHNQGSKVTEKAAFHPARAGSGPGGRTWAAGKPENEDEDQDHAAVGQPRDEFL